MNSLFLKKDEERRLLAGHLWIYSNEVDTKMSPLQNFQSGELAVIKNSRNKNLGIGYINPHTLLCARLLTTDIHEKIDQDFFIKRINQALLIREHCFTKPYYRLVFGESDRLPGLVIDRFNDVLVVQLNTVGMEKLKSLIIEALVYILKPTAILLRNDSSIRGVENLPSYIESAYGNSPDQIQLEENGINFYATIQTGQKTGWFYDQRNNRKRLTAYVNNKNVLDVFSYSGSFGIYAAKYGAKNVIAVDASATALALVKQNAELNNVVDKITTICDDAFQALKNLYSANQSFDVIILDPPAFIKRRKDIEIGVNAYLRLHCLALKILSKSGVLLTTSCSLHLGRDMLLDVVRQAAIEEKQDLVVLEQLHQAPDHPVHPAIPETNYLKGFVVRRIK